jgi:hypothetical protein
MGHSNKTVFSSRVANLVLLASTIFLAACGGSSSSSPATDQTETVALSGTAATGAAIGNAPISARCEDGSGFLNNVVTDANGRFQGEVGANALPCTLSAKQSDQRSFHSLAVTVGRVNITPLTDMAIALAGENPSQWFAQGDLSQVAEVLSQRAQELLSTLENLGYSVPENLDPLRSTLSIGDSHDQLLDQLIAAIENAAPTLASYEALLLLLQDGNLDQIPRASVDEDNNPSTQNFKVCFNPDLFRPGAELVTQTRIRLPGQATYTETTTQRMLEPTTFNGRSVDVREIEQVSANGELTITQYLIIDLDSGASSYFGSVFDTGQNVLESTYEPSVDTILDIGLDDTYSYNYVAKSNGVRSEVSFEHTFLGIETIEVPAGRIDACKMRFLNFEDGERTESIEWIAVGTGINLRTYSPSEANPQTILELESATLNGQVIY